MEVLTSKFEDNEFVDWKSTIMVLSMTVDIPEETSKWLIATVLKDSDLKKNRTESSSTVSA